MNKILSGAAIFAVSFVMGCTGEPPRDTTEAAEPTYTMPQPPPPAMVAGDTAEKAVNATTPATTPLTVTPAKPAQATPDAATAGLNPEHGKPGHRCDIAVGAPLNSPAQKTPPANAATAVQAVPTPAAPAAQASGSAPVKGSINPAHGQPGHSCAVPVGSVIK